MSGEVTLLMRAGWRRSVDSEEEADDATIQNFVRSLQHLPRAEQVSFIRSSLADELRAARRAGDHGSLGRLHLQMGSALDDLKLYDEAEDDLRKASESFERAGDGEGRADCMLTHAVVVQNRGDIAQALELCSETMRLSGELGYVRGQASGMAQSSLILAAKGKRGVAVAGLMQAAKLFERIGDKANSDRCRRHLKSLGL